MGHGRGSGSPWGSKQWSKSCTLPLDLPSPSGGAFNGSPFGDLTDGAASDKPRPVVTYSEADLVRLAKMYHQELFEVRDRLAEFTEVDDDQCGTLTREQFEKIVRNKLKLDEEEDLPRTVMQEVERLAGDDGEGVVRFEEFLEWSRNVAFTVHTRQLTQEQQMLREYARMHDLDIPYLERVMGVFKRFDTDSSGFIEKEEFKNLVMTLMNSKDKYDMPKDRLIRFWKEADTNKDGSISFVEFLLWYTKYFPMQSGSQSECTASEVYRSLGSQRMSVLG